MSSATTIASRDSSDKSPADDARDLAFLSDFDASADLLIATLADRRGMSHDYAVTLVRCASDLMWAGEVQ